MRPWPRCCFPRRRRDGSGRFRHCCWQWGSSYDECRLCLRPRSDTAGVRQVVHTSFRHGSRQQHRHRARCRRNAGQPALLPWSAACSARWLAYCPASGRPPPSHCFCQSPSILIRPPSLIMLAGICYGSQYGGSTTSILVRLPGQPESVVTAVDGYEMAKKAEAARRWLQPRSAPSLPARWRPS